MTTNDPIAKTTPVPPDDPHRALIVATPDDLALTHLSVGANTYTILLSGDDTGGRFTLIDMYVPPGGGPPPHRHDFEETFIVTEGRWTSASAVSAVPSRQGPRSTCPPTPRTISATLPASPRACCASARHQARKCSSPPSGTASPAGLHRRPTLTRLFTGVCGLEQRA